MSQAPTLTLICGMIGAGKTTFAARLSRERGTVWLNPDELIEQLLEDPNDAEERDRLRTPAENYQWDLAKNLLACGVSVILDNGFWTEEERSIYAMEVLALGARIELIAFDAPDKEKLWQRIAQRNATLSNPTFVVSRILLDECWPWWQLPQPEEYNWYDDYQIIAVND